MKRSTETSRNDVEQRRHACTQSRDALVLRLCATILCCSSLFKHPQDCAQPSVSRLAQLLDVALVGPLDALGQRALLLGLESLPRRELGPPALEAPEQLLQEERNAPVAGG